jgi:hypothetical protein
MLIHPNPYLGYHWLPKPTETNWCYYHSPISPLKSLLFRNILLTMVMPAANKGRYLSFSVLIQKQNKTLLLHIHKPEKKLSLLPSSSLVRRRRGAHP